MKKVLGIDIDEVYSGCLYYIRKSHYEWLVEFAVTKNLASCREVMNF